MELVSSSTVSVRLGRRAVGVGTDRDGPVGIGGGAGRGVRGAAGQCDDDAGGEDEGAGAVDASGTGWSWAWFSWVVIGSRSGRDRSGLWGGTERGGQRTRDRKSRVRGWLRVVDDLRGRALLDDAAVVEEHDVVGDLAGEGDLVRHDHERRAGRGEGRDHAEHLADQLPGRAPRSARRGARPRARAPARGDRDALLLPAGELARTGRPAVAEADPIRAVSGHGPSRWRGDARGDRSLGDVLEAVRCGNRLKCWNTNPIRGALPQDASLGQLLVAGTPSRPVRTRTPMVSPPTVTTPRSRGSRWLIARSSVDLPYPDGPRITVTLPDGSVRSTPSMTTCSPKAFTAPWMPMLALIRSPCRSWWRYGGGDPTRGRGCVGAATAPPGPSPGRPTPPRPDHGRTADRSRWRGVGGSVRTEPRAVPPLDVVLRDRHGAREGEVPDRRHHEQRDDVGRVGARQVLHDAEQVEQRHVEQQRRRLEQPDDLVHERRHDRAERLREDHPDELPPRGSREPGRPPRAGRGRRRAPRRGDLGRVRDLAEAQADHTDRQVTEDVRGGDLELRAERDADADRRVQRPEVVEEDEHEDERHTNGTATRTPTPGRTAPGSATAVRSRRRSRRRS